MSTIITKNLVLRSYLTTDTPAFYALIHANKKHLGGYFPSLIEHTKSIETTTSFIQEQIDALQNKTKIAQGIFDKTTSSLIGHIFLNSMDWFVPKGEVGYLIAEDWQGKGLITEALLAFSEHCFEYWDLEKIFLRTTTDNLGSQKAAKKAGFELEGLLRKDFRTAEDIVVDVHYYGKIKNQD